MKAGVKPFLPGKNEKILKKGLFALHSRRHLWDYRTVILKNEGAGVEEFVILNSSLRPWKTRISPYDELGEEQKKQ